MNAIERVAAYMHAHSLTRVTAESCTAGLIDYHRQWRESARPSATRSG